MVANSRDSETHADFAGPRVSQLGDWRLPLVLVLTALPLNACLSSVDGSQQDRLPEPIAKTTQARICAGQTPVGATDWQADREDVVHVDVDTRGCKLTGKPLYFTSLGGHAKHAGIRGATSIYRASPEGFRLVLVRPHAHELSREQGWHVNWMARPDGIVSKQLCTGRTEPEDFEQAGDNGLKVKVDLSACGFEAPPVLMTSLGGVEGHALTRGATSVYWADAENFTVFVQKSKITVEQARAWDWHINWSAMPELNDAGELCTGTTTSDAWEQKGKNALLAHVATDGCSAPLVFTTIAGLHSHWYATGTSSIYDEGPKGFALKLDRYQATPEWAQREDWHILWTRVTPTLE